MALVLTTSGPGLYAPAKLGKPGPGRTCPSLLYSGLMALTTISAITTVLPLAVKGIVTLVEKIKGDGTGKEKKPLAVNLIKTLFDSLKGTPGLGLPDSVEEIGNLVEAVVKELNGAGQLKGHDTIVSTMDAGTLNLCATLMEGKAAQLRELAKGL